MKERTSEGDAGNDDGNQGTMSPVAAKAQESTEKFRFPITDRYRASFTSLNPR